MPDKYICSSRMQKLYIKHIHVCEYFVYIYVFIYIYIYTHTHKPGKK